MTSDSVAKAVERNTEELTLPAEAPRPVLIIVMGPASCGKSTIGHDLSQALHLPFVDGDTLHPKSNIEKMSAGIPLTDDDRLPWLALIRSTAERRCKEIWENERDTIKSKEEGGIGRAGIVIACSALKKWYRDILRGEVKAQPPEVDNLRGAEMVAGAKGGRIWGVPAPTMQPEDHPTADPSKLVQHPATENLLTLFLYCHGSPELLASRIAARKGHFMGAKMLESQLKTLEDPRQEEGVAWVDIAGTKEEVGERAVKGIRALVEKEMS